MRQRAQRRKLAASIPVYKFTAVSSGGRSQCSICLEGFEEGQRMRCLPCAHSFHARCIRKWIQINPSCPECKTMCDAGESLKP